MSKTNLGHILNKKWKNIKDWFLGKEYPRSRLNKNVFFYDLMKLIGLCLIFMIIYSNINSFNKIIIFIILLGSSILLVLLYFIFRKFRNIFTNLKYWLRGLNHGTKALMTIGIILILVWAFMNQATVVNSLLKTYNDIEFDNFIPLDFEKLNITGISLDGLKNNLNSCPQIDVKMQEGDWRGLNIYGLEYDGWKIKAGVGEYATCRKGNKEGENLNYYYCGGFKKSLLGMSTTNAYIEKTIISDNGDIGSTTKHVIWNVYDENKNFIGTKCLGDPDKIEQDQMDALMRELKSWS